MSKCPSITDFNLLKRLVTDSTEDRRKFIELEGCPLRFHGDVKYGDGKLIVKDPATRMMTCYDVLNNRQEIIKLWSLPAKPKWEDFIIVSSSLPSHYHPPLPHDAHKPYIVVLSADNYLRRLSLNNGKMKQRFLLSRKHRFTEMIPDLERNWLVLGSIKTKRTCPEQDNRENLKFKDLDVLQSFMVFDYTTLQFLYHFEIRRSIFGKGIQDSNIFGGLLLVTNPQRIEVFSLDDILNDDNVINRIGASDEKDSEFICNIELRSRPPCIFDVRTHHSHLEMNMSPWLYIAAKSEYEFTVQKMDSHGIVDGGCFLSENGGSEDHLEFCPDHPSQLMFYGTVGLKVYDIIDQGARLKLYFDFPISKEDPSTAPSLDSTSTSSNSRPRRSVKKTTNYLEQRSETTTHVIYEYENELNIFGILTYSETLNEDANSLIIHIQQVDLFDGQFKLLTKVPLDIIHSRSSQDVSSSVSLIMDQDIIIISIKSSSALNSSLFIYKNSDVTLLNEKKMSLKSVDNNKVQAACNFVRRRYLVESILG